MQAVLTPATATPAKGVIKGTVTGSGMLDVNQLADPKEHFSSHVATLTDKEGADAGNKPLIPGEGAQADANILALEGAGDRQPLREEVVGELTPADFLQRLQDALQLDTRLVTQPAAAAIPIEQAVVPSLSGKPLPPAGADEQLPAQSRVVAGTLTTASDGKSGGPLASLPAERATSVTTAPSLHIPLGSLQTEQAISPSAQQAQTSSLMSAQPSHCVTAGLAEAASNEPATRAAVDRPATEPGGTAQVATTWATVGRLGPGMVADAGESLSAPASRPVSGAGGQPDLTAGAALPPGLPSGASGDDSKVAPSGSEMAAVLSRDGAARHEAVDSPPSQSAAPLSAGQSPRTVQESGGAEGTLAREPRLTLASQQAPAELHQKVNVMLTDKLQQAEIQLDPLGLGKMKIQIQIGQDQQASVQFVVQHGQTRELLEQSLPRLREMLAGQGIVLGQTQVQQQAAQPSSHSSPLPSQPQPHTAFGGQGQQDRRGDGHAAGHGQAEGEVSTLTLNLHPDSANDGGIDFYA